MILPAQCAGPGTGYGFCAQRQQLQRHLPAHTGRLYHQGSGAGFLQCKRGGSAGHMTVPPDAGAV